MRKKKILGIGLFGTLMVCACLQFPKIKNG